METRRKRMNEDNNIDENFKWDINADILLLHLLEKKPIGYCKHAIMITIVDELRQKISPKIKFEDVWKRTSEFFNLDALEEVANEMLEAQYQKEKTVFSLPEDQFGEIIKRLCMTKNVISPEKEIDCYSIKNTMDLPTNDKEHQLVKNAINDDTSQNNDIGSDESNKSFFDTETVLISPKQEIISPVKNETSVPVQLVDDSAPQNIDIESVKSMEPYSDIVPETLDSVTFKNEISTRYVTKRIQTRKSKKSKQSNDLVSSQGIMVRRSARIYEVKMKKQK